MTARPRPGSRIAHAASGNAPSPAPMRTSVRAFAPASISNIGPGFDIFGLALTLPGDEIVVRAVAATTPGVVSVAVSGDQGRIPSDPERNAAAVAATCVLERAQARISLAIELKKGIPLASGLGGSGASAVAGAVATNELLGQPLEESALLECAIRGEQDGSGARHADNVAPALRGGFVLVLPGRADPAPASAALPPRMVSLPVPAELVVAVVHPQMEVETERARALLGNRIALAAGVRQWGNAAGMVAALYRGDWELIARSLHDAVAEPVRAALVPGFLRAQRAAVQAGAAGAGLSGSGPSVFALCRGEEAARAAGRAMAEAFRVQAGVTADVVISRPGRGARVTESSKDDSRGGTDGDAPCA